MGKQKITGGAGITAGGNVNFGNNYGQFAVGSNITQTQTISGTDRKELLNSLMEFRKELPKFGLPPDEQSIVNGKVTETIKEVEKEKPDLQKVKGIFGSVIDTIKGAGSVIEKVAESDTTKKILKILGLVSLI